jgi:hypothetical protein
MINYTPKIALISLFSALLFTGSTSKAQAVRDRNVIPVAVNLNQVLRMSIYDGGNIEFVFNTIDDYRDGLSGDVASASANAATSFGFYQSSFTIASSTEWDLMYGAENATFIGVDDGTTPNTLALDNVGLQIAANGAHTLATGEIISAPTTLGTVVADLDLYPVELLGWDNTGTSNAGDEADNDFTITWRCGTAEGDMNAVSLIDQTAVDPDRYVVNVLFELQVSDN